MDECFRKLMYFFSMDAETQMSFLEDLDEEENFDLKEGHICTKHMLEVLTIVLKDYAASFFISGGFTEELPLYDKALCEEILNFVEAFLIHGWTQEGWGPDRNYAPDPAFWSKTSVSKKASWQTLRNLCKQMVDKYDMQYDFGASDYEFLAFRC